MVDAPGPTLKFSSPAKQIRSVQALRAVAALAVVGFHSAVLWHDKFDPEIRTWENGNAGVDLFFVISGFIMVISSERLVGSPGGWRRFLELRLIRIAPLYWLATTAKLASIAAAPSLALHTRPTAWNVLASYLFIPSHDAAGLVRPILVVGWTLSFEVLFYCIFAGALFVKQNVLYVVAPIMIVFAAVSTIVNQHSPAIMTLANPIVLEFVFGLVIGRLAARLRRSVSVGWILAAIAGLTCLAVVPVDGDWERVAVWGAAAALTLSAGVASEPLLGRRIPTFAVRIGEASYSLYLTHGFVLPVLGAVAVQLKLKGAAVGAFLIPCSLFASSAVALIAYRMLEVPMTDLLRRLVHGRGRDVIAAPSSPI